MAACFPTLCGLGKCHTVTPSLAPPQLRSISGLSRRYSYSRISASLRLRIKSITLNFISDCKLIDDAMARSAVGERKTQPLF